MTTELCILAWSVVLGFLQIIAGAVPVTLQNGTKWAAGPRDKPAAPPSKIVGRLQRASRNFLETFPFFAVAAILVHMLGRESTTTAMGAELYLAARVLYLPLYLAGVPVVRTLVWLVSIIGIFMVLAALT